MQTFETRARQRKNPGACFDESTVGNSREIHERAATGKLRHHFLFHPLSRFNNSGSDARPNAGDQLQSGQRVNSQIHFQQGVFTDSLLKEAEI